MSDHSTKLVFTGVPLDRAPALAERAIEHLIAQGIIERTLSDCVLGSEHGHRPGPRWVDACEPKTRVDPHFLELWTNGVEACVGREVFHAGGNGFQLICHQCRGSISDPDEAWGDAVTAWYEGDDHARFACPHCGHSRELTEWDGPWPWAFGNLGLEFWNWPPLASRFIEELESVLGHRIKVVRNRI